jgi:hypothetical protein
MLLYVNVFLSFNCELRVNANFPTKKKTTVISEAKTTLLKWGEVL